jgi:hypothetical protein
VVSRQHVVFAGWDCPGGSERRPSSRLIV